ncbi:MAG TPA: hypothetical protein DDZ51_28870 [Planctomycetaceae bacterium]|nr:hypothetical protein [Planctomycetaceae bacterium]
MGTDGTGWQGVAPLRPFESLPRFAVHLLYRFLNFAESYQRAANRGLYSDFADAQAVCLANAFYGKLSILIL